MKIRYLYLTFILCFTTLFSVAQSCANYTVTRATSITYSSIAGSSPSHFTWRNTTSNLNDDNRSFQASIGFDFWYLGVRYTQFSGDLNGFIDLSSSTSDGNSALMSSPYAYAGNYMNVFSTANASMLSIAPLYDDLWTSGSGATPIANSIVYNTTGSAPNRVLTVEWINFDKFGSSSGSINFQVKLYESTGVIEFDYGTMTAGSAALVYCCGVNGNWTSGAPTAALLLTQQTANTTTFNSTPQNSLSTMPTPNSKLTFTPPTPSAAPTSLTFTSVGKTGMTLNWNDNASNEDGYAIYNSTDNITFNFVSQSAANSTSAAITSILPGTTYYWQVYAVTEGRLSAALTGSKATLPPANITSNATGLWSATGTWVGGVVPTSGDNVTIANTHTVTIDMNAACNALTVGGGASGQLTIGNNATGRSLSVITNTIINAGATLTTGATAATHTMTLGGNLTNNGTLNLAPSGTRICNVTFNNNGNQTISGTGTTTSFNTITLNMGTSSANILDITSTNFTAITNFLTITNGTFKLSTGATITPFNAAEIIPVSGGLWVNNSGAVVNSTGGTITLYGYVRASAGTFNIGNAADNNLTSYGGTITIDGGTMKIAGRLDMAGSNILTYFTMSSGQLTVATVGSTSAALAPFTISEIGSTFNMSGGTIIIERPGVGNLGYVNTGGTMGTVTGGTLQIGDASTPAAQTIQINSSVVLPGLTVGNGVAVTAQANTNSLVVNGTLTTYIGATLDLGTTYTLGGTLTSITNNGTIKTSVLTATSATPIASGKTWGGSGIVQYGSTSGSQTIVAGTYNSLTLSNTSGTNTPGGSLVVNGTLTTTAGGTLDMGTAYTLGGTLSTVTNNGTIKTSVLTATSATPISSGVTWGGTGLVQYASTTGSQTIVGGTYNSLTLSNSSGTNTASGSLAVNGTLITTAGGTLDMGVSNSLGGTLTTVTNNGTIITSVPTSTSATPIASGKTWAGTIQYGATTGSQTIAAGTYNNLSSLNTSASNTANGALVVNGTLTTTSGGIVDMSTYALSGTLATIANAGTIKTQNTSATPLVTAKTWGGTIEYNAATGGQTIMKGTYNNLTLSNTSGTSTAGGALVVNGALTTNAGGTLDMGAASTLGGTLATISNDGTIKTSVPTATSAIPIPSGKTWAGAGIIQYGSTSGSQTIVAGTYNSLTSGNTSGTNTAGGSLVVNGTLTTTTGGTIDMGTTNILGGTLAVITNNGTIKTSVLTSTSATPIPSGETWGGTGIIQYGSTTGSQTIVGGTYNSLTLSNTSGTNTAGGSLIVNATLTTTAGGTLDMGTTNILGGTLTTVTNNGTIKTSVPTLTSATPIPSGKTWAGTIQYGSTTGSQTIMAGTYNNLTSLNTSASNTAEGAVVVNGTLTTTAGGILDMSTYALSGTLGTITHNGTIRTQCIATPLTTGKSWGAGTVEYNAAAGGQTVMTGTYNNLTISDTSGIQTASGTLTVNGTLTTAVGATLNLTTFGLAGTLSTITNNGTIRTQKTGAAPIPTGKTWGGTVQYDGVAQTVSTGTYSNLTLGGSGAKTITTATTTVNNVFSMEATATASAVPTYGASATLQYNTATSRNSGVEWLTPFAATGGVFITNTGTITLAAAKVFNANIPLTIDNGAALNTSASNYQLTFGGDFINTGGTFTANASPIVITNTAATQGISGFTTTGLISMTKTSGTATLQGNVNGAGLTINGSGGTLNLGAALTHTLTGVVTLTAGTLNGGSSILNENAVSATAWNGTGSVFSAATGTVNFGAAGAQTISASATTFNNLTFSNSGVKTLTTANCTVNGTLSMEATATASAKPTYGASASLQYNTTTARTAGVEWITPFVATGGIINANTGTISLNSSAVINAPLTLSGGKLSIGANTLTLNGGFSGSSTNSLSANGSTSNLTIGGSGSMGNLFFDQTTPGTTNRIQNIIINRNGQTITLGNTLQITGSVTPTAGTLASSGNMVLISNATATASVSAIGASADITGNVTAQRFVPASTRRYRMLSSPTSGFTYSQLIDNIFFTGPGGATNGFDASPTNGYTAYTYHESTTGGRGWKGVGNITNTASAAQGLYVFIRGDRTLSGWYTAPFPAQNNVTLDYTGPLNKGTISPSLSYTNTGVSTDDGWNLVGNPYASPVSWTLLTKSNLSAFYYTYDPISGSYVSDNGSTLIAPGQAIFVQATAASPSVTFTESAKATGSGSGFFKTANTKISMKMKKDSANSDIAWIEFDGGASANFNAKEDALKYYNSVINFGVLLNKDTVEVQYNTTPLLSNSSDTFRLFTYAAAGSYTLSFGNLNTVDPSKQIMLFDAFTSTQTDLKANPDYVFSITSNPASSAKGRLQLIFTGPSGALPVKMLSFNAEKSSNKKDIDLNWSTASEQNNAKFIVQRSVATNQNYQEIAEVKSNGNSTTTTSYSYNDKDAQVILANNTVIYYRLKQLDINGKATYTNEVAVRAENNEVNVTVNAYPNPTKGLLTITIPSAKGNVCTAEFYDIVGKLCRKATVNNNEQTDISDLKTGVYMMKITTANEATPTFIKIVKE